MTPRKEFTLANPTAPTAEPPPAPPPPVPRPARREQPLPTGPRRSAFTWRQTPAEQDALEDLTRRVRRLVGRRVDKADVLAALVDVANARDDVLGALLFQLKDRL